MDPKVYVVLGGSSPGVFARPPFLSHATSSPIMPIIIKCTSVPEANAAAGLQKNAEGNPEAFAVALAQSNQISDLLLLKVHFMLSTMENQKEQSMSGTYLSTSKSGQSTSAARHTDLEHSKTRMVYSYVRDYTGIIDTIYGKTSSPPEYPLHALGKHAGYYLEAHGYTQDTITGIEGIWSESSNVDEFIDLLAPSGMATTEIRWLWDLIRHDDDCGF
ncbi:hypothetical protein C8R43DRAFT_963962 [Mycena crocata]|nr:hypothetical protein C8R43DRAFT_963962 [Mycena crocata]